MFPTGVGAGVTEGTPGPLELCPEAETEAVAEEIAADDPAAGTIDTPTTLSCATAALARERPKTIDFMMN